MTLIRVRKKNNGALNISPSFFLEHTVYVRRPLDETCPISAADEHQNLTYFKAARYNVTRLGYLSSKYTKVVGNTSSQGFLDIICVELHVYTAFSRNQFSR